MKVPEIVRSLIPLFIGLAVGGIGAISFRDSMPGAKGSPEERANRLELQLSRAEKQIAALEKASARGEGNSAARSAEDRRRGRTFADGARNIAEDLRAGRPVTPDDLFRASKPLMRDLAPLFDRIRLKEQQRAIDRMTGELARKYDLDGPQQEALKQWFEKKAGEESQRWQNLVEADGTRLEDMIRATRDVRPDEGIESVMTNILPPEKLAKFKSERLAERAERVQHEADMKVQRIDSIVSLDEGQRDQIFGIMARGSRDYDSSMALEGPQGQIPVTQGGDTHTAMLATLRPEQRAAYDAELKRRREVAVKDSASLGLTLPPNWEMLDDSF
jgi:hypothetical protein